MHSIFAPGYKQINREDKRLASMNEKRASDNHYYLDWLNSKDTERQAHETAAHAALQSEAKQGQQEIAQDYAQLRGQLMNTGNATPGVVSNPGESNSFDTSNEYSRDLASAGALRSKINDQIGTLETGAQVASGANFAFIAANEARRQADQWQAKQKLGDEKQQLRLNQAAEAAKEYSRLLDREVEKAQIRGQLKSSEAQAAIEAGKFGLDKQKLQLEIGKFGFEQNKFNRKFGLENEELQEKREHDQTTAALAGAKGREAKAKVSHGITNNIQENLGALSNRPKIKALIVNGHKAAAIKMLVKVFGSYTAAQAAVSLFENGGHFDAQTKQELLALGYIIPGNWK